MTTKMAAVTLEPVGAALVRAKQALAQRENAVDPETAAAEVDRALVDLACSACDAVSHWENADWDRRHAAPRPLSRQVTKWRGQLDDLRVQAALAEMALRDSPHHSLNAVERAASSVESVLVGTTREVSAALGAFRDALHPRGEHRTFPAAVRRQAPLADRGPASRPSRAPGP